LAAGGIYVKTKTFFAPVGVDVFPFREHPVRHPCSDNFSALGAGLIGAVLLHDLPSGPTLGGASGGETLSGRIVVFADHPLIDFIQGRVERGNEPSLAELRSNILRIRVKTCGASLKLTGSDR
jgi:hypothetical protein